MLLLAFDTATPAVTAAVHDGEHVLAEATTIDARRHGELLLPSVRQVLERAGRRRDEVTDIAVGVGPGPYTGLRVGLVTALALGDALGVPVHGVCTLDAIAHGAQRSGMAAEFLVATDARRKEVYWARYDAAAEAGGRPDLAPDLRREGPAVDRPAELPEETAVLPCVGAGAGLYRDATANGWGAAALGAADGMPEVVSAGALAELAAALLARGGTGFEPVRPLYLRRPDAQVPAGYKAVTPGGR